MNAPTVRLLPWLRGAAVGVVLILGVSSPTFAAKRIELYDSQGGHVGYALVQHRAGRVDYYTLNDRRIGWGSVVPLSERYRVDLFSAQGLPTGYALVDLDAGRVEFCDHMSRGLGSGSMDHRGYVTTRDPSGRRRTDTALPIQKRRPAGSEDPSD